MGIEINSSKIYNQYLRARENQKSEAKNGEFSDILNSKLSEPKSLSMEDVFAKASETYGVPVDLLKAVAKTESNFNTYAQSYAGAQGIMQLMPGTAMSLGVTDSFDQEQNIMGGAKYLRQMLDMFGGDTELALAAYNAGPGNVQKYEGVPPFAETQNYVAKVMGLCGQTVDTSLFSSNNYSSGMDMLSGFNISSGVDMENVMSDGQLSNDDLELIINAYKYSAQMNLF